MQSADFDLDRLRFEMQRRYVNTNTVTERLNNFDVGKYRIQNLLEEILSNVHILNIDFARKKFAAHVFAAEVFKEHREILVEDRCDELGHSMVAIVVHSNVPKSFSPIAIGRHQRVTQHCSVHSAGASATPSTVTLMRRRRGGNSAAHLLKGFGDARPWTEPKLQ